jgi:hypothetical protein
MFELQARSSGQARTTTSAPLPSDSRVLAYALRFSVLTIAKKVSGSAGLAERSWPLVPGVEGQRVAEGFAREAARRMDGDGAPAEIAQAHTPKVANAAPTRVGESDLGSPPTRSKRIVNFVVSR